MDRKGNDIGAAHRFPAVEMDDTGRLEFLGSVPVERAGENPLMITVGHLD